MRVINQAGKTITQYDLTAGALFPIRTVREDAVPIDNKIKFAWGQEDYEDAYIYKPNRQLTPAEKIKNLKERLAETDYKIIKCSECRLLGQELPYDITQVHAQRQAIRDQINTLEQEAVQ